MHSGKVVRVNRQRKPARQRPSRRDEAPPAPAANESPATSERLQKVMAEAGIASRRQCEEYILAGRVTVDGEVCRTLGTKVNPFEQVIEFDGERVQAERHVYWFVNKPAGTISTARDTHGRPTVLDLVPQLGERVYPVGRLDEDSTGLMLLTNDGALAQRLTHPRYGMAKTYRVQVAGKVTEEVINQLKEGVWLSDGKARVSGIRRLGVQGQSSRLLVVLREGHNREIRRMFARFGHKVMKLERVAIGPIRMRKLKPGEARQATATEVGLLQDAAARADALIEKNRQKRGGKPAAHSQPRPGRSPSGRPSARPGNRPPGNRSSGKRPATRRNPKSPRSR